MAPVMKVSKNLIARIWKEADLKTALNPRTGEVIGQTATRHNSQEFLVFLEGVVATQPTKREVHLILDNFATHRQNWSSSSSASIPT